MITGDNILTAAHVAKEVNISNTNETVLFIGVEHQKLEFCNYEGKIINELSLKDFNVKDLNEITNSGIICINGTCLAKL